MGLCSFRHDGSRDLDDLSPGGRAAAAIRCRIDADGPIARRASCIRLRTFALSWRAAGVAYVACGPASTGRCCCSGDEPLHGHLVGDGGDDPAALSRLHAGFTPLQFGFIDGLYQGASALVRIASGLVGDRWRRHKEVAVLGYGLSAICKPAVPAGRRAWGGLVAIILLDRTGKGIRTAPRDALISLSTPREQLATAFGVHRALDTVGAMLGPLLAFCAAGAPARALQADLRHQLLLRGRRSGRAGAVRREPDGRAEQRSEPSRSRCAPRAPAGRAGSGAWSSSAPPSGW